MGKGDQLMGQMGQQAGYTQGLAQQYGGLSQNAWNLNGQGGQGYSPDQASGILGLNSQGNGLQGVSSLTPEQTAALQYTPDQQAAMMGNPNSVAQNALANNAQLGTYMIQNAGNVQNAAQQGAAGITGAIDPKQFNLDPAYRQALQQALGTEQQTLGNASNNPNLGLSGKFNQDYQFGAQDQQDIINSAGQTAGLQYNSMADTARRQAIAQGNGSPMAMAALQENLARQGSNAASQAMTNARIAAKNEQLGVTQTGEQMRLGTAQDVSSRQMQAGESLAGSQIGAANTQQQLALQAAGMGQGLNLQAQQAAANLGTGAAQYNAGLESQNTQFATNANLQAGQYADSAAAQRAAALAQNQQQTSMYGQNTGYNQGMGVNQAMSNRYGQVANQQQTGQQNYANAMQGNQQFFGGQTTASMGQQAGVYGAQNQANTNTYTQGLQGNNYAYAMQQPSMWDKLGAAALGAVGTAAKFAQ